MAFHLLAYRGTVNFGAVNADVPGVSDPAVTLSNNHYILTEPARVIAAYAQGTSITAARINTPTLRQVSLPYISPLVRGTAPPTLPGYQFNSDYPAPLAAYDEIALETSNDLGASTEVHTAALVVAKGNDVLPSGPAYTVLATAANVGTVGIWTTSPMTLQQTLPAGRYAVVGMSVAGANLLFARLAFPGQVWRPGVIARTAVGNNDWNMCRFGSWGLLGYFDSIAQPALDIFPSATATTQTVLLDLVKVS